MYVVSPSAHRPRAHRPSTAIGILGATVMPHSLFLGSALATQERESEEEFSEKSRTWDSSSTLASTLAEKTRSLVANVKAGLSRDSLVRSAKRAFHMGRVREEGEGRPPRNHAEHENHSVGFVERHLTHGVVDMVVSLLGLALVVNALYALVVLLFQSSDGVADMHLHRIVILAGAVFFYGPTGPSNGPATLFDAYDLLAGRLGGGA